MNNNDKLLIKLAMRWGKSGVVVHAYNPSTQETKSKGSHVWDHSGLHSRILSQKTQTETTTTKKRHTISAMILDTFTDIVTFMEIVKVTF
jgi:hypothetical protein